MRCVTARDFTVGKALAWRSSIEENAPYQREGAVWSVSQQQLFIDSLLNGYDVPKIYLHDLRGKHRTKVYAIVDGKQRLTTIWRFLRDELPLASDYRTIEENIPDEARGVGVAPGANQRFSELDPTWQQVLAGTYLSVVLIQNATLADIEDLFSRLNNGEPLNAAEKHNAIGGSMAQLAREVARHPFFTDRLPYGNERHQHFDLATKILLLESAARQDGSAVPDLHAEHVDRFVRAGRGLGHDDRERLKEWALVPLSVLARVFRSDDEVLTRQAMGPLAYLLVKQSRKDRPVLSPTALRDAIGRFEDARHAALATPADADPSYLEFTALAEGDTNSAHNLRRRLEILLERI
ncbi:MAG: DUF262 domain-containing protein [Candidatus Limnocylindrales bacterium]